MATKRVKKTMTEIMAERTDYQRGLDDRIAMDVEELRIRRNKLVTRFRKNFPHATAEERGRFKAEMEGFDKASRWLWAVHRKNVIGKVMPEDTEWTK